jgi:two-component system chemotaxis response regulator CheY
MKTLIVEDDFVSRLLLQTFLSRYGECHIAVNGQEALDAFKRASFSGSPYHLICMDIHMPGMNGKDAVTSIRALEQSYGISSTQGVKIIMTTAEPDFNVVIQSFMELCDAYLFKPVDTGKLLHELQRFRLVE